MPGHQSARLYGSARNAQTSPSGARRTRSAAYRGKELLAAEHALELDLPRPGRELLDAGVRRVARDLLDAEMPVGERGDLRQVRDRDDLRALGEALEDAADRVCRLAADPRVDFVEDEGLAACHRRDRERDPRELAARRRLCDRRERAARVRAHEEHGLVASGCTRLALVELAQELPVAHPDIV